MRVADTTVSSTDAVSGSDFALACGVIPARARSARAIVTFFFLTFAWTWGLWGIVTLIRDAAPGLGNALYLAGAFGPSFAAVFVTLMFTGARDYGAGLHNACDGVSVCAGTRSPSLPRR